MGAAALQGEVQMACLDRSIALGAGLGLGFEVHCLLPQCAVQPPSTGRAVPVMEAAWGPQRNTVSAPISAASAKRLLGVFLSNTSRTTLPSSIPCAVACSSICLATSGVQT